MPGWDNTARRGENATVYVGATPQLFGEWAREAIAQETRERGSRGLVFVNAWNEWAEGAYLEPDQTHGTAFIRELSGDLGSNAEPDAPAHSWRWSLPQAASIVRSIAGSALNMIRSARASMTRTRTR